MHQLGNLNLGDTPRVALALRDNDDPAAVAHAVASGVDILEFRVDQFADQSCAHAGAVFERYPHTPRILTLRSKAEKGDWADTEEARLAAYCSLMPLAQAVDIEIQADIFPDVATAARQEKCLVIASYHNFDETPSLQDLGDLAMSGAEGGGDVIKVATQCRSQEDIRTLAAFALGWRHQGVIAIGMGIDAALSRIFFPALGSLITYTYLGAATAPGQLTCTDTLRYLEAFYPSRGKQ